MDQSIPHYHRKRGFFTGIVARLRLVLAAFAVLALLACLAALFHSTRIQKAEQGLSVDAVPLLIWTSEAGEALSNLLLNFERVALSRSRSAQEEAVAGFASALAEIELMLSTLQNKGVSTHTVGQLQQALERMKEHVRQISSIKPGSIPREETIEPLHGGSTGQKNAIPAPVQNNTTGGGAQAGTRQSMSEQAPNTTAGQQSLPFSRVLTGSPDPAAPAVSPRRFEPYSEPPVPRFPGAIPPSDRNLPEGESTKHTGRSTGTEPQPARLQPELARRADPLSIPLTRDEERGRVRSDLRDERLALIDTVSGHFRELSKTAGNAVDTETWKLRTATSMLNTSVFLVFIVTAVVLLATNRFVIERQVNRRLLLLGRAVGTIAGGDPGGTIDLSGQDELNDIANALAVFKQNAEELRRSNSDLENFAYVAAHDLRSPLRAIHDLAQWTREDEENILSQDSKRYLELLQQRVNRLSRLLRDLLDYARAGQQDGMVAGVDLEEIVSQIGTMLITKNQFRISYEGPDGNMQVPATPVKQILLNLISNAIKHHDCRTGTVAVRATAADDRLYIEVEDDGPGIPQEYQDRIFSLFQTLRPRDELEGSGMGLAIIRKLLERYKGRIEVISDPPARRGTVFRFDMPLVRAVAPTLPALLPKAA